MKKAPITLTTLCALTVATVALAQEPRGEGPTPTLPEAPTLPETKGPAGPAVPGPGAAGVSPSAPDAPAAAIAPTNPPQTGACPPASTTRVTSGEVTATPTAAPPPPRETITVRQAYTPNRPLLYTGGSMLIGSYAATAGFTAVQGIHDANGNQPLFIPVAGPWMHLANSNEKMLDKVLIAGSGVAQGAGALIGVLSFLIPEHVPAATIQAGDVKVNFTATSYGRGSAGLGAVGQF
jgi:hypothetical protein